MRGNIYVGNFKNFFFNNYNLNNLSNSDFILTKQVLNLIGNQKYLLIGMGN